MSQETAPLVFVRRARAYHIFLCLTTRSLLFSCTHVHAVSSCCTTRSVCCILFGRLISPKRYIISLRFVPSLPCPEPSPALFSPYPPSHPTSSARFSFHRFPHTISPRTHLHCIDLHRTTLKHCSDSFCTATLPYINTAVPVATLHPLSSIRTRSLP